MFEDVAGPEAVGRLAAVVPADLDDADLIEVTRGWVRLASWVAAGQLAAIAELARRRPRTTWTTEAATSTAAIPGCRSSASSPSTRSRRRCG